jgi:hypothetical protein
MRRLSRPSWPVALTIHLVASLVLAFVLLADRQWALSDVAFYYDWSGLVARGEIPYRDFFFDYPPLALLPLMAPRVMTGLGDLAYGTYLILFAALMAILAVILSLVVRRYVARLRPLLAGAPLRRHLLAMTLAMPILFARFDLWPILLTALAFLAIVDRRPGLSGLLLGLGIAAKLYPVVLLPVFAGYSWFAGDKRGSLVLAGAAVLVAAASFIPFALMAPGGGLSETLRFQQDRGLQIETTAAGVLQLIAIGAADRPEIVHVTTYELVSDGVAAFLSIQPMIAAIALGGALLVGWYRLREARDLPHAPLVLAGASVAVLLAFVLTNRALSPQHVYWLLPFVALLPWRRSALLLGALVTTLLVVPLLYDQLLAQDPVVVVVLNLRNALLLTLAIALLAWPILGETTTAAPGRASTGSRGGRTDSSRRDSPSPSDHAT